MFQLIHYGEHICTQTFFCEIIDDVRFPAWTGIIFTQIRIITIQMQNINIKNNPSWNWTLSRQDSGLHQLCYNVAVAGMEYLETKSRGKELWVVRIRIDIGKEKKGWPGLMTTDIVWVASWIALGIREKNLVRLIAQRNSFERNPLLGRKRQCSMIIPIRRKYGRWKGNWRRINRSRPKRKR